MNLINYARKEIKFDKIKFKSQDKDIIENCSK